MPPPITANIFSTPQFKDAYDNRPQWASEYSRTEYYDRISAKGWTPENHAWVGAKIEDSPDPSL